MANAMINSKNSSSVDWQLLGKYTITRQSLSDTPIRAWLVETLVPLNLKESFLDKVLLSAQLAAENTLQSLSANKFEHIHLLLFTSAVLPSDGETWGFFRIEKIDHLVEENQLPDHAIEFYLYLEGK